MKRSIQDTATSIQAQYTRLASRRARAHQLRSIPEHTVRIWWATATAVALAGPALAINPANNVANIALYTVAATMLVWAAAITIARRAHDDRWAFLTQTHHLLQALALSYPTTPIVLDNDSKTLRATLTLDNGELRCTLPLSGRGDFGCALYCKEEHKEVRQRIAHTNAWPTVPSPTFQSTTQPNTLIWSSPIAESLENQPNCAALLVRWTLDAMEPDTPQTRRWPLDISEPSTTAPLSPVWFIVVSAALASASLSTGLWYSDGPLWSLVSALSVVVAAFCTAFGLLFRPSKTSAKQPPPETLNIDSEGLHHPKASFYWSKPIQWTIDAPWDNEIRFGKAVLRLQQENRQLQLATHLIFDDLPSARPTQEATEGTDALNISAGVFFDVMKVLSNTTTPKT